MARNCWGGWLARTFGWTRDAARRHRGRLALEHLEDRLAPAVQLSYGGVGTDVTLTERLPGATRVVIEEAGPTHLLIDLGTGTFDSSSSNGVPGLTYEVPGNPTASNFATIDIRQLGNIRTLLADLPGDALIFGTITDANGGLGDLDVSARTISVAGAITLTHASAGLGELTLNAKQSVSITGSITTRDGSITVLANQGPAHISGGFIGIDVNGANLTTTGAGSILLAGRGGEAVASGGHSGVVAQNGAVINSQGSGAITLQGTGGLGTTGNDGVVIQGAGTRVTTVSGTVAIVGQGGNGSGNSNTGVLIASGAVVNSTSNQAKGLITIAGTGGLGDQQNYGVDIAGNGTQVSSAFAGIAITGQGGGSFRNNVGVVLEQNAQVNSQGQGPGVGALRITGIGGQGREGDHGVLINSATVTASSAALALTGTPGSDSQSVGIALQGTAQLTGQHPETLVSLTADGMAFDPTTSIDSEDLLALQPLTAGTAINLGGADSPGTLGLSAAEMNVLGAGTLRIGSAAAGALTVSAAISLPDVTPLTLIAGGAITETGSLTVRTLRVAADGAVSLNGANRIDILAAQSGGSFSFTNTDDLTIGEADGVTGITALGNVVLTATTLGILTGGGQGIITPAAVDLKANNVFEQAGSLISADALRLRGGTATLTGANAVNTLAADTTGAVTFNNAGDLAIGTVFTTAGVSTGGQNVTLTAGGNLLLLQPVQAALHTARLTATGAIIDAAPGVAVAAASLVLTAAGIGSDVFPLKTAVTSVAFSNTGGGSQHHQQRCADRRQPGWADRLVQRRPDDPPRRRRAHLRGVADQRRHADRRQHRDGRCRPGAARRRHHGQRRRFRRVHRRRHRPHLRRRHHPAGG